MPRLSTIGEVPVAWNAAAHRYLSPSQDLLAQVFNRMKPVPDPIIVMVGPSGKPGGDAPWEGNDPATGRRYVARKAPDANAVLLQEVTD